MSATTCILKRLQEAGFSQTEISRRAGIPQPTLSKWAAGKAAKAADAALRLRDMEIACLGAAVAAGTFGLENSEQNQPPAHAQQAQAATENVAQEAAHV